MPTDRTGENPGWTSDEPYYDDIYTAVSSPCSSDHHVYAQRSCNSGISIIVRECSRLLFTSMLIFLTGTTPLYHLIYTNRYVDMIRALIDIWVSLFD